MSTATFNDSSYNDGLGPVTTATFIPLFVNIGQWTYPSNRGSIDTANIYWLQTDNELGGMITTANYLGYP
jgi:hypothetical protein